MVLKLCSNVNVCAGQAIGAVAHSRSRAKALLPQWSLLKYANRSASMAVLSAVEFCAGPVSVTRTSLGEDANYGPAESVFQQTVSDISSRWLRLGLTQETLCFLRRILAALYR